jgi:hypothetical protein
MSKSRRCKFGNLRSSDNIIATNNTVKLNLGWSIFGIKPTTETVHNCILAKTNIFINRHSEYIQAIAGVTNKCRYNEGSCKLADSSIITWEIDYSASCRLTELGYFEGLARGSNWVAKNAQIALSFIETNHGFAIENSKPRNITIE